MTGSASRGSPLLELATFEVTSESDQLTFHGVFALAFSSHLPVLLNPVAGVSQLFL